ncbi:hypothetical protein GOODEAATRI_022358 [Goodea atripinnis]|uniref:Uncharacterized protein n=1 Tax=Goodea atripinnis TaxID=208336 RepID=A0ABV0MMT8_9TELE
MASRTKFYTVAEALDLITMDCGTEVCAEDFSSEDEYLFYPDKLNDELDFAVPPLEMELVGKMVGAGGKEGFSSSRNNPIPREDEPNFHPAALNFTTMTTALDQEVAGERPLRLTCVHSCGFQQQIQWPSLSYRPVYHPYVPRTALATPSTLCACHCRRETVSSIHHARQQAHRQPFISFTISLF